MPPCAISPPSDHLPPSLPFSPAIHRFKPLTCLRLRLRNPVNSCNPPTDPNPKARRREKPAGPLRTPSKAAHLQSNALATGSGPPATEPKRPEISDIQPTDGSVSVGSISNLFDEIPQRKAPLYAAKITSHGQSQRWEDVLLVFISMVADGAVPDKFLIPKILKACSALRCLTMGAAVHGYMVRTHLELDVFVGNSLIDMYAKCNDLASSRAVFDRMPERDVVSWTALVNAYADMGLLDEASGVFELMRANGVKPDLISWNALISGFARHREIDVAIRLLGEMQESGLKPGANSWNGVISGCVQNGCFEDALEVFRRMRAQEKPNAVTIASILPACSGLQVLNLGEHLHSYAIRNYIKTNVFVGGSLINMYVKCGKLSYAEKVFSVLENKNVAVWNEMIAAYADEDKLSEALELRQLMLGGGFKPDVITYNTFLAAYARKGQKDKVVKTFSEMGQSGLKPNVISMNAVISGFHHAGLNSEALEIFQAMQKRIAINSDKLRLSIDMMDVLIRPNAVTITSTLSVCTDVKLHRFGKEIHGYVLRNCMESNAYVSSALVDMYAKCRSMVSATMAFQGIRDRTTVSWNVLMAGHSHNGRPEAALKLFPEMLAQSCIPNSITLMILLLACSNTMSLRLGKELHGYIEKNRPDGFPVTLSTALIDMYAKCGSIRDARLVFDYTVQKDVAVWNAMMAGYSLHGMATDAISLFKQMEKIGIKADRVTFTVILSACTQEGFVEEGWKCFNIMEDVYGVAPSLEHFTCMIDILGTAGLLQESVDLIRRMPFEPDACVWATLLKACKLHSDYEIGEKAARALFELEPSNASNYIVLSNIFATAGMWDAAKNVRSKMRDRGLKTVDTCSWINIGRTMHSFKAGDLSHPDMKQILDAWDKLANKMRQVGYFPQKLVFCDEDKVDTFNCYHTEKLAVCFGIISLTDHDPICVSKNVRMCMDCHSSIKLISKIQEREIFVADGCFFHHFKDGVCSCREKW